MAGRFYTDIDSDMVDVMNLGLERNLTPPEPRAVRGAGESTNLIISGTFKPPGSVGERGTQIEVLNTRLKHKLGWK